MDESSENKFLKAKVALLETEKKHLVQKLADLEKRKFEAPHNIVSSRVNAPIVSAENRSDFPIEQKIQLLRNIFRSREDVHARYWISRKTGKSGYSPVCKNEWIRSICKKPTIKCSACLNRELSPLTDDVIKKHLAGMCSIGIYPMLPDETCYFLAVDFDDEGWIDNISAFKETCSQKNIPVAIERSKSGNGAHAWIFFEEKILAALARRLGSFLITETMSKRYQLSMKSYDRLFPNQDTLPKGGFGNLIALPFQKDAVSRGNSVFIDDNNTPYPDQWRFLSNTKKMTLLEIEKISHEATACGQILGVRMSPTDESDPPWMILPSGKRRFKPVIKDLPQEIELVVANKIYIKVDSLPSVLLNQIKRLAAFQNPEFYKRQNMRLSTAITPRIICCSEISDGYLSLPRGCLDDLSYLMEEYGIKITLKDERMLGKKAKFKFFGALNKEQKTAARKILKKDIGIFVAPPGSGKTIVSIYTMTKRRTNTLILVHRKPLIEQWRMRLSSFLGLDLKGIGQIGGGKNNPNGMLDIAMIQSMERKGMVDDRIADYGFVIVDECHHVSAVSFERVLLQELARSSQDKKKAILATGAYIGEGFDDPRLDTLFITMPISFRGKLVQYAGRLHRDYPGKKDVQIYDYVDKEVSVLWSMHQKRLKTYKNIGYFVKEG